MRSTLRAYLNHLFVRYPSLGQWGYDFLRVSNLDRSTRGTKGFLKKLVSQEFNPQLVFDIGANHGGWSRMAKSVFPAANFVLIEPQEEMAPFLNNFCDHNPGSFWIKAGAGTGEDKMVLTVWDDLQGSAIIPPEIQALTPYTQQREIPIISVDGLITAGKTAVPNLIKIDVQGYEVEVLRGCLGCMGKTDVFIVETSLYHPLGQRPTIYRVIELLEAYGYHIYDIPDLKYRSRDGALGQVDLCFILQKNSPLKFP